MVKAKKGSPGTRDDTFLFFIFFSHHSLSAAISFGNMHHWKGRERKWKESSSSRCGKHNTIASLGPYLQGTHAGNETKLSDEEFKKRRKQK